MKEQANTRSVGINEKVDLTAYLLSEFQTGNTRAFSRLYDMYVDMLFNYGYRLTTDRELLKDCIHDVFIKVYTRRNDLGSIGNFKSYLFISLKNKICDEVRKRVYMSDTAIEEIDPASTDDIEDRYLRMEKTNMENNRIAYLLEQLSPRQREALTLYYIEERQYEDICTIMQMNYQSVRNLMYRGLTKLRNIAK